METAMQEGAPIIHDEADTEGIYDRLTAEMPPDPTRLVVLPYFEMTGSPEFVSNASGVMGGLGDPHSGRR